MSVEMDSWLTNVNNGVWASLRGRWRWRMERGQGRIGRQTKRGDFHLPSRRPKWTLGGGASLFPPRRTSCMHKAKPCPPHRRNIACNLHSSLHLAWEVCTRAAIYLAAVSCAADQQKLPRRPTFRGRGRRHAWPGQNGMPDGSTAFASFVLLYGVHNPQLDLLGTVDSRARSSVAVTAALRFGHSTTRDSSEQPYSICVPWPAGDALCRSVSVRQLQHIQL